MTFRDKIADAQVLIGILVISSLAVVFSAAPIFI
jgi:hypothetical protein